MRAAAAAALGLILVGSIVATLSVGWYLRSPAYRRAVESSLSARLALPSEVGRVVPRSWSSREYRDIVIWLPERRGRAMTCDRALVRATPQHGPSAYEIDLFGGAVEISTRTWLSGDYRGVIESGLRPGFSPDGPHALRFQGMVVRFQRDDFELTLSDTAGSVEFEMPTVGRARATATRLNGFEGATPVTLEAEFSPRESGVRVDQLTLSTPDIPLGVLGLRPLVGADVHRGSFQGRLAYREDGGRVELELSGRCRDIDLAECTHGLGGTAWRGRCDEIELLTLRLGAEGLREVAFRGRVSDLQLDDVLARWALDAGGGVAHLDVGTVVAEPSGIRDFVASGRCVDVSLDALTQSLGMGRMTGVVRVHIDDVTIVENHLKSLKAAVRVVDADDAPNWIEGRLLHAMAEKALQIQLPNILPERVEYVRLGLRLEVRDEVLRVYGSHGPGERTILTVRIAGQDFPLIQEPRRPFDLTELTDWLRETAAARIRDRLRGPASRPAP